MEVKQDTGPFHSLVFSSDSDIPISDSEAHSVISYDPEKGSLLSALGSKKLDVGQGAFLS